MDALQLAADTSLAIQGQGGVFLNEKLFEHAQRVANLLCHSSMVPEAYRGKENIGNCVIAIDYAWRMNMQPLTVMQNLAVVHGNPGWLGKMVIGLVNTRGPFKGPIEYEFRSAKGKDDWGCRAFGTLKSNGEKAYGPWVDIALAKQEGWYTRKSRDGRQYPTKWQTNPELMLRYRAGTYLGRTVCPEVLLGLMSDDELRDIANVPTADGPVVDVPSLGEVDTGTPDIVDTPAAQKKDKPKKDKSPKKDKAPPPAAEKPADPPPPAEPPPNPEPQPTQTPEPQSEPQFENQAQALAYRLNKDRVDIDDFLSWLKGTGRDHDNGFDADKVEDLSEIPGKLMAEILSDGGLDPCIKIYQMSEEDWAKRPQ